MAHFSRKYWRARLGVGLNKFSINGEEPVELINVPDEVTQEGDALSAENFNDLENRIEGAVNTINTELNNKVEKDGSKVLTTNDYSNIEKQKVTDNTEARHIHSNKNILDNIVDYLKNAVVSDDEEFITITKNDGSQINFQGGGKTEKAAFSAELKAGDYSFTLPKIYDSTKDIINITINGITLTENIDYVVNGNKVSLFEPVTQGVTVYGYILSFRSASLITVPVEDNLNSTDSTRALSANQGRILNKKIPVEYLKNATVSADQKTLNIVKNDGNQISFESAEVVDNLDSSDEDKALSANQGKILNEKINLVNFVNNPIGSYMFSSIESADSDHYKICNGASLLRNDYPELFNVIGTTYGSADDDHFNIPDWRDKFISGSGGSLRLPFGQTQNDAIRNIVGRVMNVDTMSSGGRGALNSEWSDDRHWGEDGTSGSKFSITLDANNNYTSVSSTDYDNPMAGHANGKDIHPVNMIMAIFIRYK